MPFWTAEEAADYLKINVEVLRRKTRSGELPGVKVGRLWRYRQHDIDEWVAAGCPVGKAPTTSLQQLSLRWQMPEGRFNFIDLFAGIGGLRIPFAELGGACVFSSEIDEFACRTYETNFGEKPAGDITKIDVAQIPPHDILVGGFPCQPFSIAGVSKYGSLGRQHGFADETKGTLFFHIQRIIDHHRPRAFLLENVRNLLSHDRGQTWTVIKETLETDLGYKVTPQVVDAALLVPQHRERIFIVGFREEADHRAFVFPRIADQKPRLCQILDADVPEKYTLTDHLWTYLQNYAAKHRAKGNGFGYGLADLNGVSRTLSARYHKDGSEILIPQDGRNPRRLTPRECGRLMGFPEDFEIPVSDTQAYRQFGNAVVVPVVRIVANAMLEAMQLAQDRRR